MRERGRAPRLARRQLRADARPAPCQRAGHASQAATAALASQADGQDLASTLGRCSAIAGTNHIPGCVPLSLGPRESKDARGGIRSWGTHCAVADGVRTPHAQLRRPHMRRRRAQLRVEGCALPGARHPPSPPGHTRRPALSIPSAVSCTYSCCRHVSARPPRHASHTRRGATDAALRLPDLPFQARAVRALGDQAQPAARLPPARLRRVPARGQ